MKYLLFILPLMLASCVYSNSQSFVQAHQESAQTINSDKNYEEAYRIISTQYKGCLRVGELAATSKLDKQAQVGTIENYIDGIFMTNYTAVIKITPSGAGSVINIYSRNQNFHDDNALIPKWLNGYNGC